MVANADAEEDEEDAEIEEKRPAMPSIEDLVRQAFEEEKAKLNNASDSDGLASEDDDEEDIIV